MLAARIQEIGWNRDRFPDCQTTGAVMFLRAWLLVCCVYTGSVGAAFGETVTLAELQGVAIHDRVIYQEQGLRADGRPFSNQMTFDNVVTINSESSLTNATTITVGGRVANSFSGTFTVGDPKEVRRSGGGHAVFIFEGGKLTLLSTFKAGGFKRTITFTRAAAGLRCGVSAPFARESGAPTFNLTTGGGVDVRMTDIKPISSSCEVSQR
jgi:hypothetical protein